MLLRNYSTFYINEQPPIPCYYLTYVLQKISSNQIKFQKNQIEIQQIVSFFLKQKKNKDLISWSLKYCFASFGRSRLVPNLFLFSSTLVSLLPESIRKRCIDCGSKSVRPLCRLLKAKRTDI